MDNGRKATAGTEKGIADCGFRIADWQEEGREPGPGTGDQERHCGFRIADCGMEGQGPSQGAFSGEPQATARPWLAASHVGRRAPRVLRPILWAFAPRERGIASAF